MTLLKILCCCVIGYFLGNFSPSYLFGRKKGYGVRKDGSGNAGATNTFILLGASAFFLTAVLDILKAFAAYQLCRVLFPDLSFAGPLGGVMCIMGHIFPVLLGFRGGKGMASLGGVVLAWSWKWFLILLCMAILIAFATRYVCVVAPAMSVIFPACHLFTARLPGVSLLLLLPAIPIFFKHWDNFVRIREGTEMRTSFIWNKEAELKRIGKWNPVTEEQLDRRGK